MLRQTLKILRHIPHTVKPHYRGQHRDLKIVSVIERCPVHREGLPKLAYFTSKPYFRVLGYRVIEPKVYQKVGAGRGKSLKAIY